MTATPAVPAPITAWHELVVLGREDRAAAHDRLDALLAEDVVFRSPAVHTPQEGKEVTTAYLRAALVVLGPGLTYHREWYADDSAVLEFTTDVGGKQVHGVDMVTWGPDGRITDFTVLVRPVQGLEALIAAMAAELSGGR
ncbi:MAG: nuclear transport factor 2 family protein [Nocardioides sp.]|nr:nuclear transport factor 2 family protein [Nocardioides sp.]